jgi:hypothetical protein
MKGGTAAGSLAHYEIAADMRYAPAINSLGIAYLADAACQRTKSGRRHKTDGAGASAR